MTTGNMPALSYNAQQYRVRLELSRAMALASPVPPLDLVQRAKSKLEAVKKEGKIAFYDVYEEKLNSIWKSLRSKDSSKSTQSISFTFGAGSPIIKGLEVSLSSAKPGVFVSNKEPIDLKVTHKEWIKATIIRKAKDLGVVSGLFAPHVQSAIMRITLGEKLNQFHIAATNSVPVIPLEGKVYSLMANRVRGEIVVFVGDLAALQSDLAIEALSNVIRKTMEKVKEAGGLPMRFLKLEMIACIKSSMQGPEGLNVGMPFGILAAMQVNAPVFTELKPNAKKYLNFVISPDKMEASISGFDRKHYSDPAFVMKKEFLLEQLSLSQIRYGLTDELFAAMEEVFNKRGPLDKLVVAKGKEPIVGGEPYLHLVYKDAPKTATSDEVINVRDAQQRNIVQKGHFVAEVRYKIRPETGYNVVGQALPPSEGPALPVTIGDGIQQRSPGKFYSTCDGLPKFEEGVLTISRSLVHEGDVNLKSGNIYFDGAVEIKGTIETGAVVRVRGPLKIHGSITGGIVISKEPIEVLQSIVTGDEGKVICNSNLKADFIENSRIEVDGAVTVNRSLVSSEVISGILIHATSPDGVIGGGTILCRGAVIAANIGFTKGAKTILKVGVDNKVMRKIKIRQLRVDNLIKAHERYKNEFRELAQKKEAQLTLKHKKLKEELKEKLINVKPILDKATVILNATKGTMNYNHDALIAATNVFAANCDIEIAGHQVIMEVDTIAAAVTAKKRRDSHICTYDEIKNEVEKKLGVAEENQAAPKDKNTKKAS